MASEADNTSLRIRKKKLYAKRSKTRESSKIFRPTQALPQAKIKRENSLERRASSFSPDVAWCFYHCGSRDTVGVFFFFFFFISLALTPPTRGSIVPTGRRLIATAARGDQPLEVERGLPGFQLSRFPDCTCAPQRRACRGGAAPTGRGPRPPAVAPECAPAGHSGAGGMATPMGRPGGVAEPRRSARGAPRGVAGT